MPVITRWMWVVVLFAGGPASRCYGAFTASDKPLRIGSILVIGNEFTPDSVIHGFVQLYPGELLKSEAIREAGQKLDKSGFFKMTTVQVIPFESGDEFVDIIVVVIERPCNWLLFGFHDVLQGAMLKKPRQLWAGLLLLDEGFRPLHQFYLGMQGMGYLAGLPYWIASWKKSD